MNVRHPMGALHLFSIKNIFYDKVDLRLFYFDVVIYDMRLSVQEQKNLWKTVIKKYKVIWSV